MMTLPLLGVSFSVIKWWLVDRQIGLEMAEGTPSLRMRILSVYMARHLGRFRVCTPPTLSIWIHVFLLGILTVLSQTTCRFNRFQGPQCLCRIQISPLSFSWVSVLAHGPDLSGMPMTVLRDGSHGLMKSRKRSL
jgi:hypothetical protein